MYFASFIKLRLTDPNHPRPFKIPGGILVAWLCALLCIGFIFFCALLFVFPDLPKGSVDWGHTGPILGGYIAVLVVGEIIIRSAEKKHRQSSTVIVIEEAEVSLS